MTSVNEALNIEAFHLRLLTLAKPIRDKLDRYLPFVKIQPEITYTFLNKDFDSTRGAQGNAAYWTSKVKVHPGHMNPTTEPLLIDLLNHEIAHIYAYHWRNKVDKQGSHEGHGFYWGALMIYLGYNPYNEIRATYGEALAVAKAGATLTKDEVKFEDCPVCGCKRFFSLQLDTGNYKCDECGKEIKR